jgi:hypothetical protein
MEDHMKTHTVIVAALSLGAMLVMSSCAATDVVAGYAASSFEKAAGKLGASREGDGFLLKSPSGETFWLAADLVGIDDAVLELDAKPFLDAGLDPAKLPVTAQASWSIKGTRLIGRFDLGAKASKTPDPQSAMAEIAKQARSRIAYHAAMKHYGVMLSGDAMVEWAADLAQNDKDWVFILDPGFLRAAGTDPGGVRGWALAMVQVEGPKGSMIEIEKLLKAFDLP